MDELLTPASIIRTARRDSGADLVQASSSQQHSGSSAQKAATPRPQPGRPPASPEDALETLRREPDYDSLISVLRFLSRHGTQDLAFPSIKLPSPLSAQLVQVLVSDIVPNYWALLIEDAGAGDAKHSGLKLLLYCLSSVAGINAILVRLRALIQEARSEATDRTKRPDISLNLGILLDLLSRVLHGDGWLLEAWQVATSGQDGPARVRPRVHEIAATFGSGRIVSLAAEAEEIAKTGSTKKRSADDFWPADSLRYSLWLGRNIVTWQLSDSASQEPKLGPDLLAKALRLGHSGKEPCHRRPALGPAC